MFDGLINLELEFGTAKYIFEIGVFAFWGRIKATIHIFFKC